MTGAAGTGAAPTCRAPLMALALAALILLSFWSVLSSSFVNFDDNIHVYANPDVQTGLTLEGVVWAFTNLEHGANWHPLTWMSHQADVTLFGLDARGHHLVSLVLHLASTLLLFVFLHRATGALWAGALVAALFALHPLHVESVAWVAERKDVLSAFFWMLTLVAYLRHVRRPTPGRYLLAVVCMALGLMAKPMVVTLPFALLLLDFWPLGRHRTLGWWRLAREKLPFLALSGLASITTLVAQQRGGVLGPWDQLPIAPRIAGALTAYTGYLVKTVWPTGLSVIYPYPVHDLGQVLTWKALMSGLALILLTAAVLRGSRSRPYLVTGWFWYLGTLVPVIGLIQENNTTMADRYTYLPLVGIFVLAVWGAADLGRRARLARPVRFAAGILVLAILVPLTRRQAALWKDTVTLFRRAVSVTEGNWLAHKVLGLTYFEQGLYAEAEREYREALRILPGMPEVANNLGSLLARRGAYEEAVGQFRTAQRGKPDYFLAGYNLGSILMTLGRLEEAKAALEAASRLKNSDARPHNNLGAVLFKLGRPGEAAREYAEALRLDPGSVEARSNLGLALETLGRSAEARAQYAEALRRQPGFTPAVEGLERIGPLPPTGSPGRAP